MFAAVQAGARGYLVKGARQTELLRAVRAVAEGGAVFGPAVARRMVELLQRRRARHVRRDVPRPDRPRARDPRPRRARSLERPDRRPARPVDQDGPQPRLEHLHQDPGRRPRAGDREGARGGHRRAMSASVAVEQGVRTSSRAIPPACAPAPCSPPARRSCSAGSSCSCSCERAGIPSAGHRPAGRQLVGLAAALPVLLLGALMLARLPRHPIGWILCVVARSALLLAFAAAEYATYSHYRGRRCPPGAGPAGSRSGRRRRSC